MMARYIAGSKYPILLTAALLAASAFAGELGASSCTSLNLCPCSDVATTSVSVQQSSMQSMSQNAGQMTMSMPNMKMTAPTTFIEEILAHSAAGTAAEPNSTPHDMLMAQRGAWTFMFHGVGFLNSQQQTGPRGGDKVFGTSWFMPMAQRDLGNGTLTVRGMFSLDPATITGRQYPELFQVGETAFGKPIVDGQHPHNFFMELAAIYDWKLAKDTLLSFYAAPVGDPAIGPEAFPHRVSASEDTLAPLGHHLQDSTHIADDVVTLGLAYKIARIEVSGVHGREPNEHRWEIQAGAIDSWSARFTLNPTKDWSGQYSITHLTSPEQLFPSEDTLRMTASVTYNKPLRDGAWGNWATTLVWGRNRNSPDAEIFNSYLAESTARFANHNYAWTRIENADRTNELLLGENPIPPGFQERFVARIQAYTFGYDHEWNFIRHISTAFGGQYTLYTAPPSLDPIYGSHPMGVLTFLRFRAIPSEK